MQIEIANYKEVGENTGIPVWAFAFGGISCTKAQPCTDAKFITKS
jgi:hypothetical protein